MKNLDIKILKALFVTGLLFNANAVLAQDIHFSQFNVSPVLINPATAGTSEYNYRLISNYKNQWSSVSSSPYSTTAVAYDMGLFQKPDRNNYLGLGITAFTDAAGKSRFGTSEATLNLSGVQKINEDNFISVGLMGGYAQRKIKMSNLSWDSQYNGEAYDPNLATNELEYNSSKSYLDMGTGVMWQQRKSGRTTATVGASMMHLNKPTNSFNPDIANKLNRKYMLNGEIDIKLASHGGAMDSYLHPKFMYTHQGPHNELILGLFMKYLIQAPSRYTTYHNVATFEVGGFYRVKDAFVISAGMDYSRFKFGVSYDLNTSKLRTASTYRGGLEVCFAFKGIFSDNRIKLNSSN